MARLAMFSLFAGLILADSPSSAGDALVTLSGTISYTGSHSGDTLYVAVIDTSASKDVSFLALRAYAIGLPPLNQPYSIDFPGSGAPPFVILAALLDVDGGGVDSVSGSDIVGWYAGSADPVGVSSSLSQSGLDFVLPRAEVHGTITLVAGQTEAWIEATQDPACRAIGFRRPPVKVTGSGPYSITGLYAGTWCVYAEANIPNTSFAHICYGDPNCVNPSTITLNEAQIRVGVDLDFTGHTPAFPLSWGRLKARY